MSDDLWAEQSVSLSHERALETAVPQRRRCYYGTLRISILMADSINCIRKHPYGRLIRLLETWSSITRAKVRRKLAYHNHSLNVRWLIVSWHAPIDRDLILHADRIVDVDTTLELCAFTAFGPSLYRRLHGLLVYEATAAKVAMMEALLIQHPPFPTL